MQIILFKYVIIQTILTIQGSPVWSRSPPKNSTTIQPVQSLEFFSPNLDPIPSDGSLEIKDPAIIFNNVWNKIEKKYGTENLRFPKEIIWLMGAPGAGKSFNAPWILKARGITAGEVVMSSLLTSPEAEKIKKEAGLVGDSLVVELLLEQLLRPEYPDISCL
jgi:adenylate kinase